MPPTSAHWRIARAQQLIHAQRHSLPLIAEGSRQIPYQCRQHPLIAAEDRRMPPTSAHCHIARVLSLVPAQKRPLPLKAELKEATHIRLMSHLVHYAALFRSEMALLGHDHDTIRHPSGFLYLYRYGIYIWAYVTHVTLDPRHPGPGPPFSRARVCGRAPGPGTYTT